MALLPATALVIGVIVLTQIPQPLEIGAVGLVIAGVLTHQAPSLWLRASTWLRPEPLRRLARKPIELEGTITGAASITGSLDVMVSGQGTVSHPDIEEQVKQLRRDVDRNLLVLHVKAYVERLPGPAVTTPFTS